MNLEAALKILVNPHESPMSKALAEEILRDSAGLYMQPLGNKLIAEFSKHVIKVMSSEEWPEPVRLDEDEINYVIALLQTVESDHRAKNSALAKLKHKEKTMRNRRNRIRSGRES